MSKKFRDMQTPEQQYAAAQAAAATPAAKRQEARNLLDQHQKLTRSTVNGTPWAEVREEAHRLQAEAYELGTAAGRQERKDSRKARRWFR